VTRFLAALRRFFRWFTVDAEVVRFLRTRGEVADAPEPVQPRGRLYMTRAATNRVLIPHERDCQDLPTWERLAALYLVPEGEKA
jgi:hypothetical protein